MIRTDTICAISTPPGRGAIAMVRLSGKKALSTAQKLTAGQEKHAPEHAQARYLQLMDGDKPLDDAVITYYKAPRSYTGEDMLEISCHGSVYIQQRLMELLLENGALLAEPGEFTMRAYFNGKLDLSQAEAVADLIAAGSQAAHKIAISQMRGGFADELSRLRKELLHFASLVELELDFSEEDLEFADRAQLRELAVKIKEHLGKLMASFRAGRAIKEGVPVAIAGPVNAGKSTLLNRLLREERALVSDIPGTTRDSIEDLIDIGGIPFRISDTAGLRQTTDKVEQMGIERSYHKARQAMAILYMMDATAELDDSLRELGAFKKQLNIIPDETEVIILLNKIDLIDNTQKINIIDKCRSLYNKKPIAISAREGDLDSLAGRLSKLPALSALYEGGTLVNNLRHYEALHLAHQDIERVLEGINSGLPHDLLAQDIRHCLHHIGNITGEIGTEDILGHIFENFCIGK